MKRIGLIAIATIAIIFVSYCPFDDFETATLVAPTAGVGIR